MRNNLSKSVALKKLKLWNFTDKAKYLAIDNEIARRGELNEVDLKLLEHMQLFFATRRRNNSHCNSFTRSPACLLFLGLVNAIIAIMD